ncbi:hypothetical protein LTR09_006186 [Extremus antarcticus]|uniref:Uncharacterized protein n=1 Tax=Extremus antarcticus TaxID=702011 RepID=A0AAJ0G805_9PEZI|nr:hypothetical protein LTR09_006186 [Extremus antarcticus]
MNGYPPFAAANGSAQRQSRKSVDSTQNGHRMQDRNGVPKPVGGPQQGGFAGEPQFGPMAMGMPRSPPKNKRLTRMQTRSSYRASSSFKAHARLAEPVPSPTMSKHPPDLRRPALPGQPFPGAQPPPHAFQQPPPPGLLSLQAQGLDPRALGDIPQEYDNYQYGHQRNGYEQPQIDMTYTAASPPAYGSPPHHDSRFANSPPSKGLSVLDAPLPNSFDSNGISVAARNGPFAASVPSRFGVESPPASLPRKTQLGSTALRDLHNSAFGDRGMDGVLAGSSPPSGPDEPLTFPKRSLHIDRLRAPRQQMISASLGTKLPTQSFEYSDDEDGDTDREEDLLPASLRDLIPEGRSRKESRSQMDEENTPASFLASQRRTISGQRIPTETSKYGSPHASSPSRYTSTFLRSYSGKAEGDGVVGSPLRNSSSYFTTSAPRTNGDLSPTVSSPPRQASMSMLTKELQRTKLDGTTTQAQVAAVGMSRTLSNGSNGRTSLDRAMSSNSVGRERIDEEQDLFDMDEVGAESSRTAPRAINGERGNGVWSAGRVYGSSPSGGEPTFGAIGGHRTTK